jgi:hypothetical protein
VNKQTGIIVGAVVAAILLIGGVAIAVSGGGDDEETAGADTVTTTTTTVATSGGGGGSGSSGGGGGGGGPTGPQPAVVSFATLSGNADVDCHNGNDQNFSVVWDTTDAVRVSISQGGDNLPADGETSLPFDCLSAPHTYTLTAYGSGGRTASKSLTLPARNVQGQDPPDEDEGP